MITVGSTPTTTNYTYNAANQLTSGGVTYDANGNMLNDGVNSYTWDRANRLLSMGGASYAYDGEGRRVQQSVAATVTKYLLDLQPGLSVVLSETTGANVTRYVHGPRGIHAQKDVSGNWEWMVQDGLGSVRAVTDANADILWSTNYDPFGVSFGSVGTAQTVYGFTGEETDGTGQVYLRARYYNPSMGVFPSLDPFEGMAGRAMSLNGYSWVEGNVTNFVDLTGQNPIVTLAVADAIKLARKVNQGLCDIGCNCDGLRGARLDDCLVGCSMGIVTIPKQSKPCCGNVRKDKSGNIVEAVYPEAVTAQPCPNGPPRILDYDKGCDGTLSTRDGCAIQVYRKVADEFGNNGCLTWGQFAAMIFYLEAGVVRNPLDQLPTDPSSEWYVWSEFKEASIRLLTQRCGGSLSNPDILGFLCFMSEIESWYAKGQTGLSTNEYALSSVSLNEFDTNNWSDLVSEAEDALSEYRDMGIEPGKPASWGNIFPEDISRLYSKGLRYNNLKVAKDHGFFPVASVYDPRGLYSDPDGYSYFTIRYDAGGTRPEHYGC